MMGEMVVIRKAVSKFFGDFVSKIVSDGVDILKGAIKDADLDRKSYNQNLQTRLYQLIVDALNGFTYNKYEKQDKLYDAAESILKGYVSNQNNIDAVKSGLKMLVLDVNNDICQEFLETLCGEICRDENNDLYKEIDMFWRGQTNGNLKEISQSQRKEMDMLGDVKSDIEYIIEILDDSAEEQDNKIHIENRAKEYADKWNKNVFLNDFDEEDENAGINIKLREIYQEVCLPYYIWKANIEPSDPEKLKKLLRKYTIDNSDRNMLLILGQPGIGKSTLITWIMSNLVENMDKVLVYQFASDLRNVNWQGDNILDDIFKKLDLGYNGLDNKVLILDGFDEVYASDGRENILNQIYRRLKAAKYLKNFSIIITCRENYVYKLNMIKCDFIILQAWNGVQIQKFCTIYSSISKCNITENMIEKILDNKKIFGIPLILYMVLALNIAIEESGGIIDIYDQIFSLEGGGMYDRCIRNSEYGDEHIIISKDNIKYQIHQISQRIAFWIFENNPEKAYITQEEYERICDDVMDEMSEENEDIKKFFLIGNYLKLVKHCEGIDTDELHFVHRSIYEYFVVVYFYESIYKLKTVGEMAGKFGELLKDGQLSEQILAFIKYKFDKMRINNLSNMTRNVFQLMLRDGMTYYTGRPFTNILNRELNVFSNMLEIVRLWNFVLGNFDGNIVLYLQFNKRNRLNLAGINLRGANLAGVDLTEANLEGADLKGVNLEGADLTRVNLVKANLIGANLIGADLTGAKLAGANLMSAYLIDADLAGADLIGINSPNVNLKRANLAEANLKGAKLKGADLTGAKLKGANLAGAYLSLANLSAANLVGANLTSTYLNEADLVTTIFDTKQVELLHKIYDLVDSNVYIEDNIIEYKDYFRNSMDRKM